MFDIKNIKTEEIPLLFDTLKKCRIETYSAIFGNINKIKEIFKDKKQRCLDFAKMIEDKDFFSFICKDKNKVVGNCFGYIKDNFVYIKSLYVLKKYHGH